jgi:ribosome-associated toxin RatA of RatAB toxin-antitoxin module
LNELSEGQAFVAITKLVPSLSILAILNLSVWGYIAPANAGEHVAHVQHSQSHQLHPSHNAEVTEEKIGNRVYQTSKVTVHSKPENVWRLLTDYDNAHSVFPCVKKCKLVKDKGTHKIVEHSIKPSGFPGSFTYVLEIKETPNRLQEWRRISGDFHEVDGFWRLEPSEDGNSTHVTYASYVNGGFFMPQALIKRQTRMDVPAVMAALKTHAETSHQHLANANADHKSSKN